MPKLTLAGLIGRFFASLVLVLATYNPGGYSFLSWVIGIFPHIEPLQAVVGVVLLGLWIFFLRVTWQSLGTLGIALGLAFFAAVIWLLTSAGWLKLKDHGAATWTALVVVACILTMGLCWSFIRSRVSGQEVVEEVPR